MTTEALRHVQFLNSCDTYTRQRLARIQNRARLNTKTVFLSPCLVFE